MPAENTPKQQVLARYPHAICERGVDACWRVYSRPVGAHGGNLALGKGARTARTAWRFASESLSGAAGAQAGVVREALALLDEAARLRDVGDIRARDIERQARELLRGGA